MRRIKNPTKQEPTAINADFFERLWEDSWTYIKTVVDVAREPMLILDEHFNVITANGPFYKTFHVDVKNTEHRTIYKLGNGQWDIPALRKLLEGILPKHTFFRGFEVSHNFPLIGHKVMLLNARQLYPQHTDKTKHVGAFPRIILLAIEDVTRMIDVVKKFTNHAHNLELKLIKDTQKLETNIVKLKKEIEALKKKAVKGL